MTDAPFSLLLQSLKQLPSGPELPIQAQRLREAQAELDHLEGVAPDHLAMDRLADRVAAMAGHGLPELSKKEARQLPWALNRGTQCLSKNPQGLELALWLLDQSTWRGSSVYGLIESRWQSPCQDQALLALWEQLILKGLAAIKPSAFLPLAHWQRHGQLAFGPRSPEALRAFLQEQPSLQACHALLCPQDIQGIKSPHHPFQQKLLRAFVDNATTPEGLSEVVQFLDEASRPQLGTKQNTTYLLAPLANALLLRHMILTPNTLHQGLLNLCVTLFDDPRLGSSLAWNTVRVQVA